MPTTTSITTTYAGESAGKYIAAALLTANTIENGGITVIPNIKFRQTMKKVSATGLFADAGCDFVSTGTVTLTERVLQPKEIQVNVQFCKQDFVSDWDAISMGYSAFDNLPPSFQEFIIAQFLAKISEANENNIWQGSGAAASGTFEGLVTKLAAAGNGVPAPQTLTAIAGGINSGNVIGELGKIVDVIPSTLFGNEQLKIYVPQNVLKAYVRALGGYAVLATSNSGTDTKGTQWWGGQTSGITFDGIPLFLANGLPSNKIVATTTDNIFFGTSLESDKNEIRILDMAPLDGSQNVRFVARFTAGTQFGIAEDIVKYGI